MMKHDHKLKKGITLALLVSWGMTSFGQPPVDYKTKVSYHEKKEVSYTVPDESDLNCLTLSELSRYHGYMQFYSMDEYVDLDGDVLSDQKFIEERYVRDDWMKEYSRITVGKNSIDIYDKEGNLYYQKLRELDSSDVFLSEAEAATYGYLNLDSNHFTQLKTDLESVGFTVQVNNDVLSTSNSDFAITYDNGTKVASTVEYDSNGYKSKESVVEYDLSGQGNTYFAKTETVIEWILTDDSCCIRRVTVYHRFEYDREVVPGQGSAQYGKEEKIERTMDASDIELLNESSGKSFIVKSEEHKGQSLKIVLYDMAGKIVLETNIMEGQAVSIPQTYRAGMYLVHVFTENGNKPTVGKIIKPNAGVKF
ncbi:MAG: T9SS type A sorting domain-containing protein [Bacteroidia bacterium]